MNASHRAHWPRALPFSLSVQQTSLSCNLEGMINAPGLEVWPAAIEAMRHGRPAIREACVIAARKAHRGETVKAS